mmetsp:Transcript_22137/g.52419  ORF Transcript_22137/g.52419 Transcript_22137/m.52419 type:complete len:289 (-) Transcript_22137:699-1565(-)
MLPLDGFQNLNDLRIQMPLGRVMPLHLPRVVHGLDLRIRHLLGGEDLAVVHDDRAEAGDRRGPLPGHVLQGAEEADALHLPPDGAQARIGEAEGRGGLLVGGLGRHLLADGAAGLGDVVGLDAVVPEPVHRVGEGLVGLREDRADGVQRIVQVEGDEAERRLVLLRLGGSGGSRLILRSCGRWCCGIGGGIVRIGGGGQHDPPGWGDLGMGRSRWRMRDEGRRWAGNRRQQQQQQRHSGSDGKLEHGLHGRSELLLGHDGYNRWQYQQCRPRRRGSGGRRQGCRICGR